MDVAYPCFIILVDACFSYDIPHCLAFDPAFACCLGARERSSAPPNRRASKVRRKTAEINLRRPALLDLSLPPLARLALSPGHRQARRGLASRRLSPLLDLESAA